jgi:probable rRNA maturation factor
MTVDLVLEDARWGGLEALAEQACGAVMAHLGYGPDWEVSLLACDDARIAELNGEFRAKDRATNVLSWPSEERGAEHPGEAPDRAAPDFPGEPLELGDIAIAYDTCARESEAAGKPMTDHVTHLLVHGVLHLLGFDHIRDKDAALMEGLEVEILGKLGLSDPYYDA